MSAGAPLLLKLLVISLGIQSRMAQAHLIGGTLWVDVVTTAPPPHHRHHQQQQQQHKLHVVSTMALHGPGLCAPSSSSPWRCWLDCAASWNQSYQCPAEGPHNGGTWGPPLERAGWHVARATFEVHVATRGWAALWNVGCCWVEDAMLLQSNGTLINAAAAGGLVSWTNPAFVSLDVRADTGRPNASPRAAVVPLLRLNNRCNATIRLRVLDPDGDLVRCAFAAASMHGGVTEGLIENAVIDSDACEIHVGRPDRHPVGRFAVLLSVSDWSPSGGPQGETPLSHLPLQFLLQFAASPLPCASAPAFVPHSPAHGARLSATMARSFTMGVQLSVSAGPPGSSVRLSRVTVLTMDGVLASPPVREASRPGVFLSTVTWTPRPRDLGSNWLCFYAEDSEGRQSEVRCVHVVVKAAGDLDVVCAAERMSAILRRAALRGYGAADLALSRPDPGCELRDEGEFVVFDVDLLACGTTFQEDAQRFVFTQRLTVRDSSTSIVSYEMRRLDIVLQCILNRVLRLSSVQLQPSARLVSLSHAGHGELSAALRFYDSADFSRAYDAATDFPLRPSNFQRLFFECSLDGANSSSLDLSLVTQSCYATPSRDPADPVRYPLISHRCISEKWMLNHTTHPWANRFSFLAFAFLKHPNVYLHCGVMACRRGSREPRCVVSCPAPEGAAGGSGGRGEREPVGGFVVLTGGPIVLPEGGRRVVSASTRHHVASVALAVAALTFAVILMVVRNVGKCRECAAREPLGQSSTPARLEGESTSV